MVDRPPGALLLLRVAIHLGGDVLPAAETDPHCGAATSRRAVLAPREEVAACTLRGRALVVRALFVFEEARATKAALAATLLALLLLWRVRWHARHETRGDNVCMSSRMILTAPPVSAQKETFVTTSGGFHDLNVGVRGPHVLLS